MREYGIKELKRRVKENKVLTFEERKYINKALEDIQQYRAIGTIEEFKALKEKSVAKKCDYQKEHEKCPTCGSFHVFGCYCSKCGQKVIT